MKTMNKKKTFRSYDQSQLKVLSDHLCDQIEPLLDALGITDYKDVGKMISMSCPIHDGDNESAFNLYHQGDNYRGNWKCRTHKCEETFKGSIIGFIRGCLSQSKFGWNKPGDDVCSFQEAIDFATSFLKEDLDSFKTSNKNIEKNNFVNTVKYISTEKTKPVSVVTRSVIKKSLDIPSKYFINRGFSTEILNKYDVGECSTEGKEMYGRAVVPIYDIEYKHMIGCSGRSIYDLCQSCNTYHPENLECPESNNAWKYSKWKHSFGFKSQEHLYNYWFAKDRIKKTNTVILVESPGNVWRLEEAGIHNSVAIFGSSLADKQKMLLDISGAMTIITIMDNDEAGKAAAKQIYGKCYRTYNIKNIELNNHNDIGSMTIEEVKQEILTKIGDNK